ncbi:hypothetical protein GOV14_05340 [Candidatus Pacearchaeota archaeon]|nr:hypothetical protein [Candidatus Pacearchaeota archaeon]
MEEKGVIIIGKGIAGAGLAYNLEKQGFKGKVLIIDSKEELEKDSYRITFEDTINKYKLPYDKIYPKLFFHLPTKEIIDIKVDSYLLDYDKTCKYLLKKSKVEVRNEKALNVKGRFLQTDKNIYRFEYLVDASGNRFFLRKLLKLKLPVKYWIGKSKIFKANSNEDKEFHYFFNEDGFFEDVYQVKDKLMYGFWKYVEMNNIAFNGPKNSVALDMIKGKKQVHEFNNLVPCSPVLPLVYKRYAFLGDSFGNATTASAEGIKPIMDSSEILAFAIKNSDLNWYETNWKKAYLNKYLKFLAFKMVRYPSTDFWSKIKKNFLPRNLSIYRYLKSHPEVLWKILRGETFVADKEFKRAGSTLNQMASAWIYLKLKLQYA